MVGSGIFLGPYGVCCDWGVGSSGGVSRGMPVKAAAKPKAGAKLTAKEFERKYGAMVSREFSDVATPRMLRNALSERRPAIEVSEGMLKVWFSNFRSPAGGEKVSSARELNEKYGDVVAELAKTYASGYLLAKALRARDPPVVASDGVVRVWLRRYRVDVPSMNTEQKPEMPVD